MVQHMEKEDSLSPMYLKVNTSKCIKELNSKTPNLNVLESNDVEKVFFECPQL